VRRRTPRSANGNCETDRNRPHPESSGRSAPGPPLLRCIDLPANTGLRLEHSNHGDRRQEPLLQRGLCG
jgi:hypothetical protein